MADSTWMTSDQAARRLGVKPATLYAYVSRGLIRSERVPGQRRSRFLRADVERHAMRSRRGGRAGGLEVIVESELTLLEPGGRLFYRGWDVTEAARRRPPSRRWRRGCGPARPTRWRAYRRRLRGRGCSRSATARSPPSTVGAPPCPCCGSPTRCEATAGVLRWPATGRGLLGAMVDACSHRSASTRGRTRRSPLGSGAASPPLRPAGAASASSTLPSSCWPITSWPPRRWPPASRPRPTQIRTWSSRPGWRVLGGPLHGGRRRPGAGAVA